MEDHRGHIDLRSTKGEGTSFFLYFPASRESIVIDPTDDHLFGGDEKILAVDDDPFQRNVTVTLLKKLGYEASVVESGEEAVQMLKTESCDLIVLDMIMPGGIDGAETYKQVLELHPEQKAIIVSGYAESDRVQETLRLGAGAFVRKPLTIKSLAIAVRKELDRVRTAGG
jgi:CheY-like chemotaxis protein